VEPICCRPFRPSVPHQLRHASVSTPRSSNRTCGFAASGSRRRLTQSPRPLHVTPSATSENNLGVIRLIANLPFVVASCVRLQLRPLPSAGVTRYALQRVTGITLGVLLRRASQPSNRLSRFLAERSAGFVDGTTPHNHVVFLEPKHIDRTSVDGGEKQ